LLIEKKVLFEIKELQLIDLIIQIFILLRMQILQHIMENLQKVIFLRMDQEIHNVHQEHI